MPVSHRCTTTLWRVALWYQVIAGFQSFLIHDFAGHPFQAELSRSIAGRGHRVLHAYCGGVTTGRGDLAKRENDPETLDFLDVAAVPFERYRLPSRMKSEIHYGRRLAALVKEYRPSVLISANSPLLSQQAAWMAGRRIGCTRIYWLQDLLGRGAKLTLARRSRLLGATLGSAWEQLERVLLRRSDGVLAISPDFLPILSAAGVMAPITVLQNWAPLDEVAARPKRNKWSRGTPFAARPTALYAGTLGLKHDPELLLQAADAVGDAGEIVVMSQGLGRQWLENELRSCPRVNLHLFDYVPYSELSDVLGSADVCLVLLEANAGRFSVPSKLLTYLAAGRAVVAALPLENEAANVLERSSAGIVVPAGAGGEFGEGVARVLADPRLMTELGRSGRRYAEAHFGIEPITDRVLSFVAGLAKKD